MDPIGQKIRDLRKQKGLTLTELAERTGLSQGFLSQLERSKSSVTLQSISKISEALEVSRSYFFEGEMAEKKEKTPHDLNMNHNLHRTNFFYQSMLGNIEHPIFEPMLAVLLPEENSVNPSQHKGQEFVYVLEGELTLIIGNEIKKIKKDESFHIDSSEQHTWYNATENVVKLIYVFSNISI